MPQFQLSPHNGVLASGLASQMPAIYTDRSLWNWAFTNPVHPAYDTVPPCWLPSIHMPRRASRISLVVTGVRVERVQDITNMDAVQEGVDATGIYKTQNARAEFAKLWDSINAKRGYSWEINPWVWVVEFRRI